MNDDGITDRPAEAPVTPDRGINLGRALDSVSSGPRYGRWSVWVRRVGYGLVAASLLFPVAMLSPAFFRPGWVTDPFGIVMLASFTCLFVGACMAFHRNIMEQARRRGERPWRESDED